MNRVPDTKYVRDGVRFIKWAVVVLIVLLSVMTWQVARRQIDVKRARVAAEQARTAADLARKSLADAIEQSKAGSVASAKAILAIYRIDCTLNGTKESCDAVHLPQPSPNP